MDREKPLSLTFFGVAQLFTTTSVADSTVPLVIKVLHWVSQGWLQSLSLPVQPRFVAQDVFTTLSLKRLTHLTLARVDRKVGEHESDMLRMVRSSDREVVPKLTLLGTGRHPQLHQSHQVPSSRVLPDPLHPPPPGLARPNGRHRRRSYTAHRPSDKAPPRVRHAESPPDDNNF